MSLEELAGKSHQKLYGAISTAGRFYASLFDDDRFPIFAEHVYGVIRTLRNALGDAWKRARTLPHYRFPRIFARARGKNRLLCSHHVHCAGLFLTFVHTFTQSHASFFKVSNRKLRLTAVKNSLKIREIFLRYSAANFQVSTTLNSLSLSLCFKKRLISQLQIIDINKDAKRRLILNCLWIFCGASKYLITLLHLMD